MSPSNQPIAYVVKRFPTLSETFVLNELLALEDQGLNLHIFSLVPPNSPRYHSALTRLRAPIGYLPGIEEYKELFAGVRRAKALFGNNYGRERWACLASGRPELLWRLWQSAYIAARCRELGITHLHAQFAGKPTSAARMAARMLGGGYSFTAHAVDIYHREVDPEVLGMKVQQAEFTVTVSESNRRYLASLAPDAKQRVHCIYNGIDLERFTPRSKPVEEHPFTVLSVARLVPKKGLDLLIEACARLHRQGRQFRCWIIGEGSLRTGLQQAIENAGLRDTVRLLQPHTQDELLPRYRDADLYVMPARVATSGDRDGLPVSIVEALACGLPVVSTAVNGIPEAVETGVNGLLVAENDPDALAAAMGQLMDDRQTLARLASRARGSVANRFDRNRTAAQLAALLRGD